MKKVELWNKINKEENGKIGSFILDLYERWEEEKAYEDINDYLTAFQKYVPEAVKAQERPFGFICSCEDGNLFVFVKKEGNYIQLKAANK